MGPWVQVAVALARTPSVADLTTARDVTEPDVSPDGREVLYTVTTVDTEYDQPVSDVILAPVAGGPAVPMTSTPTTSEYTPRFSPRGDRLAFLSDRADETLPPQLWVMARGGGEARELTSFAGAVEDYAWTPDGTKLVAVVSDADPAEDADPPLPIVVDRYAFLEDGVGFLTHVRQHLWLVDAETGEAVQLTSGDQDDALPAVSPDGTRVAFVSKRGPDADRHVDWNVWVMPLRADGVAVSVTPNGSEDNGPDVVSPPAWSPDSRELAVVIGGDPANVYYSTYRVAVVAADGSGPPRLLHPDLDRSSWKPRFSPDGKDVVFLLEDDGAVVLARVPSRGGKLSIATPAPAAIDDFALGGKATVVLASDPLHPPELFAVPKDGKRTPITQESAAWLEGLELGQTRRIAFPSTDGVEVHGFLVTPPGWKEGERVPTLLRIHGGPVMQVSSEFRLDWQLLATGGYAVVSVNPRGSSGRGKDWAMGIWARWGEKDGDDVLAAVDHAVALGIADPERLGILGWSYGGILTNQVVTRDHRFDAAISGAGLGNALAGLGTDMYVREYVAELGLPWADPDAWLRNSAPFLHADRIVTPTLFLCGEDDVNVPLLHSEQMYQALRILEVPTELVVYPGEAHDLTRPSFVADRATRYLDWFDRWVK